MKSCPSCLSRLEVNKKTKGLSHVCTNCGVRSLDFDFIKDHLRAPDLHQVIAKQRSHEVRNDKNCQASKCKIRAFNIDVNGDGKNDVELDICYNCNQVWFDLFELDQVAAEDGFQVDTSLSKRLQEELDSLVIHEGKVLPKHLSFASDLRDFSLHSVTSSYKIHGWKSILGFLGLPIEIQNRLRSTPFFTYGILAVITFVSIYALLFDRSSIQSLGFIPAEPLRDSGLTIITAFFVHGSWGHLLGNLYSFFIFGDNVEDQLGPSKYLALLFAGTIAGNLMHALLTADPGIPLVGASTGISALIVYYALSFPGTKFSFLFGYFLWIRIPVYFYVLFWIGLQLIGLFASLWEVTAVSFGGHLGGALAGVFTWLCLRKLKKKPKETSYS